MTLTLNQIGDAQDPYFASTSMGSDVQVFCLTEELGEAIEAALGEDLILSGELRDTLLDLSKAIGKATQTYRRMTGRARRTDGTWDDFGMELADIVIVATHLARLRGLDLDAYVEAKLAIIRDRRAQKSAKEKFDTLLDEFEADGHIEIPTPARSAGISIEKDGSVFVKNVHITPSTHIPRVVGPRITDHDPVYPTQTLEEVRDKYASLDRLPPAREPGEPMSGYPLDGKRETR